MIRSFGNQGTEDIFDGKNSKIARKTCPRQLWKIAARKLEQLDSAALIDDLKVPPGNRLEALVGDPKRIEVIANGKAYRQFLKPGDAPVAEFQVDGDKITIREYCNIHGLWKS